MAGAAREPVLLSARPFAVYFVPFFRVVVNWEVRTGDSALREKTWIEIKRFKLF